MNQRKEVSLPSGALLRVQVAPFKEAKTLYQILLRELRGIRIEPGMEMAALYKDLFCIGFSSPGIESALWDCFKSCTYDVGNGEQRLTIENGSVPYFEPVERRDDYMVVCAEVAKENVVPFGKSLYAEFLKMSELVNSLVKNQA